MKTSALGIFLCCISFVACNSSEHARSHKAHSVLQDVGIYGRVANIEILSLESEFSGEGTVLRSIINGTTNHEAGGKIIRDEDNRPGVNGEIENLLEKNDGHDSDIYRITVALKNGGAQKFDYEDIDDLRVGDKVRVKNGQLERL